MKLSIIIPVFNERTTISTLIAKVFAADIGRVEKEVVVVDDGSNDGTDTVLKNMSGIVLSRHNKNMGKGSAIRTAIPITTGDIILIQDADLEYDPRDYLSLIQPIVDGRAEAVYGSRQLKKSNYKHSGILFFVGGISLTLLTNLLFPSARLTDEATCYKVFRGELLRDLQLTCKRFEFCPEVTCKILRRGIKILEVPINYYPRGIAEGKKIRLRDGIAAIWTLIRYRFSSTGTS